MRSCVFNNYIGKVNEMELSWLLNTPLNNQNGNGGIDLLDSVKGVEVKGCLIDPFSGDYKKRYAKWTLFDYQLTWHEKYDVPLYCAVGTYQLDVPISRIWTRRHSRIESHVACKDFSVVPWSWTLKFPISKGDCSDYRYLRPKPDPREGIPPIPEVKFAIPIKKGLLRFTEGVDMSHFSNVQFFNL